MLNNAHQGLRFVGALATAALAVAAMAGCTKGDPAARPAQVPPATTPAADTTTEAETADPAATEEFTPDTDSTETEPADADLSSDGTEGLTPEQLAAGWTSETLPADEFGAAITIGVPPDWRTENDPSVPQYAITSIPDYAGFHPNYTLQSVGTTDMAATLDEATAQLLEDWVDRQGMTPSPAEPTELAGLDATTFNYVFTTDDGMQLYCVCWLFQTGDKWTALISTVAMEDNESLSALNEIMSSISIG